MKNESKSWKIFLEGRLAQEEERFNDALNHYNEVLQIDPEHGFANVTKGCVLARLDQTVESNQIFDELFSMFHKDKDIIKRYRAIAALSNKGFHLTSKKMFIQAVKVYDELIVNFFDDVDLSIRYRVFLAMLNKINILRKIDENLFGEEYLKVAQDYLATNPEILNHKAPPVYDDNLIAKKYTKLTQLDLDKNGEWVDMLKVLIEEVS